jgi:hypothetical protein
MIRARLNVDALRYSVRPIVASDGSIIGYEAFLPDGTRHPLGAYFHAQARNTLADCLRWANQTAYEANQALGVASGAAPDTRGRQHDGFRPCVRIADHVYHRDV